MIAIVVVISALIRGGSSGYVPSVACRTARYRSTSLQQLFNGSFSLHVSDQNILDPPLNSGANAAPVSVQALAVQCHYHAGTDVGRGSLETTGNRVSGRPGMPWGKPPRRCPITLPSRHHLYIILLINKLHCFLTYYNVT